MSEADLREGLRAAVGDEPPLRFDADELIQRAQHVRRRRRALVAVALATLVLTGSVLSLPGLFDRPSLIDVAKGPVLTTTAEPTQPPSAVPSAVPSSLPPTSMSQRSAAPAPTIDNSDLAYLSEHLTARFAEVVPKAKIVKVDFADTRPDAKAGVPPGVDEQPGYVTGYLQFLDAVGTGGVVVQLSAPPLLLTRDQFCASAGCDQPRRQADGSYLEFATLTEPDSKMITYSVAHFRSGGSVVQVNGYNYDPIQGGGLRAEVALTTEQLVELATDPGLTVK